MIDGWSRHLDMKLRVKMKKQQEEESYDFKPPPPQRKTVKLFEISG